MRDNDVTAVFGNTSFFMIGDPNGLDTTVDSEAAPASSRAI